MALTRLNTGEYSIRCDFCKGRLLALPLTKPDAYTVAFRNGFMLCQTGEWMCDTCQEKVVDELIRKQREANTVREIAK